ncbi:MAG: hypothetical protein MJZ22_04165 [Candidatus Saccharibacteria bacterium]|nr:hypothetical protein [Candidatus Saccharibacteria bacterium]
MVVKNCPERGLNAVRIFPEETHELFAKTEQFAKLRYEEYKKLNDGK